MNQVRKCKYCKYYHYKHKDYSYCDKKDCNISGKNPYSMYEPISIAELHKRISYYKEKEENEKKISNNIDVIALFVALVLIQIPIFFINWKIYILELISVLIFHVYKKKR